MSIQRKLILCHTPFHLLMAEAILENHDETECELWLIEDFPNGEILTNALKAGGRLQSHLTHPKIPWFRNK